MKAIISSTLDPLYLFYVPISIWSWNKLGIDTMLLFPYDFTENPLFEVSLKFAYSVHNTECRNTVHSFSVPSKNHEATYTQVSRLFAAAELTHFDDKEVLVTTDSDMLVFQIPPHDLNGVFSVFGADLVPQRQFPMCYVSATAAAWRKVFVKGRTLQECLDDALAGENCQNMRGNLWSRDQELLYNGINLTEGILYFNRAYEGTQFATHRVDRDNHFWEQDLLNSGSGLVDAHLWRPGYTEENTEKIIRLFEIMYPQDSFHWIREYAAEFRQILNQQQ